MDNSRLWDKEDDNIYQIIRGKKFLLIINKIDEQNKMNFSNVSSENICRISAKNQQLSELEEKIKNLFSSNLMLEHNHYPYLSQSWQQSKLNKLIIQLEIAIKELQERDYLDAICGNLEISYKLVKELGGKDYNEELLDIIFSKFCLGK
ncbi:MAG: tRNA modification GTPase MnmE [Mycoplasmataceae bacterium]|nr:MAG: tRNA modification GTPase MnmE [Mycoplasmataceae bacterium]